ncbi:MAG TPA: ComEC/Rec2 family competence protein [Sediminibacterium sp.]|nr:ComEC/Rec2 family competence protein [Sediminibacterium sp.]
MQKVFKPIPWYRLPFVRATLALITGITIGRYAAIAPLFLTATAVTVTGLFIGYHLLSLQQQFRMQWIAGTTIHLVFCCLGCRLMQLHTKTPRPFLQLPIPVIVQEPLSRAGKTFKTTGVTPTGKTFLYFSDTRANPAIQPGTELLLLKKPAIITATGNPGGFNFREFAATQEIFYQVLLHPAEFRITGKRPTGVMEQWILTLQKKILHTLNSYIPGKKETAVAEALLIGYRKNLDKELLQAYSNTGVVHIIAISGLHLGMIYGLLLFLLKPLNAIKGCGWLKPLIVLLIIWVFSILTGASASILRAAVMFSFVIIGAELHRSTFLFNSLAAAACCLLCYKPLLLWDIGFQLSYAAVLGIGLFAKPITGLLFTPNRLLQHCWQMAAVTIAAQLLTLPLLLYYFHQFPYLFILTNFIAIPLSGLILYLEIFLLIISPFNAVALYAGQYTGFLLSVMNRIISNAALIPFGVSDQIQINLVQVVLLYLLIAMLGVWLMLKQPRALLAAMTSLVAFAGVAVYGKITAMQQQKLIVYAIPKTTALDILEGNTHRYLGSPAVYKSPLLVRNYLNPTRTLYRATRATALTNTIVRAPFLFGGSKTILIVRPGLPFPFKPFQHKIDLVIISGNPNIKLDEIHRYTNSKYYVFDSSNDLWKIEKWKKEAENLHLRRHSVPDSGAFEFNL